MNRTPHKASSLDSLPFKRLRLPLLVASLCFALSAHAEPKLAIEIQNEPLDKALNSLAKQTGVQILFASDIAADKKTTAFKGNLTAGEALSQMLKGTNLAAKVQGDGTYIVVKAPIKEGEAETLPEVAVSASTQNLTTRNQKYSKNQSVTSTKMSASLADTPFSVQSISEDLRRDQAVTSVREVAENISGVIAGPTSIHEDMLIRGFQIRDTYRNGVPTRRIGMTETSNVEAITVVKGPSSVLFGRGEVGGLLNVETKKVLWEPHLMLQQRFGSRSLNDTSIDAGDLITDTFAYRVNGLYRNSDSFRDGVSGERYFIAPTFNWKPTEKLDINLELEAFKDTTPNDKGQIAVGNGINDVARDINFSGEKTKRDFQNQLASLNVQYQMHDDWKLKATAYHEQSRENGLEYVQAAGSGFGFADNIALRLPREVRKRDIDTNYINAELWGNLNTGDVKHELVFGADHNKSIGTFHFNDGDVGLGQLEIIDINQPIPDPLILTGDDRTRLRNTAQWTGLYAQDHISLTDRLSVLLGVRHDNAKTETFNKINNATSKTSDSEYSPRIGVTYKLTPDWRIFGQYTESVGFSNSGTSATGQAFKPEMGKQTEVGFKYENAQKNVMASIAAYNLVKENILVPDVVNLGFDTQSGKAGSKGVELDFSSQLTSHWNVLLAYAYTDTNVIKSTNANEEGNELYGVPHHAARVFLRYDVEPSGIKGWSFGGGAYAVSSQQGDIANSFEVAGYTRWDAFAAYRLPTTRGNYTFQLNAQNLTDRHYYVSGGSRDGVGIGEPQKVIGTLRVDF